MTDTPQRSPNRPRKGDVVEVTFDSLGYGGEAIARHDGFVLFVRGGAPGDRARVRVVKSKSSYGEGQLLEVVEPSALRVPPPCDLFGTCGGCSWQHLPIEEQRRWKHRIVRDSLRPLPDFEAIPMGELVASPDTWRYRNKMEFTFQREPGGPLVAGFHKPGNWRAILDVKHCHLAPEAHEQVLRAAVAEGERQGLTAWNPRTHEGTLRHLVLRHSATENSNLAMLLVGDERLNFGAMADAMMKADPTLKGVLLGLNDGMSDVARARLTLATRGEESFEEQLGRFRFRVSLASFFQTNTRGAEKLYQVALDALELTGRERLFDAYCGTGTIGIFCSDHVRELYGIDLIQEAIWDARENAARNNVKASTFMAGDMRTTLPAMVNSIEGRIDRLVVDPPRGGMDQKALTQLLDLKAPVMVYVSCNPTTMARDLQAALDSGYVIEQVTPVDMFPQTYHVECVAKLRRRIM
jgi:23S rRNA (uracil1939-C5)-methyltransferase